MDCGPAALKALLEGFGIPISLGHLREICQTTVDGTSIDALEDVAVQLGLMAEQRVLPSEHLLSQVGQQLPALVVTFNAMRLSHFVVIWSRIGNYLQIMDPAIGRQWVHVDRFQELLYQHSAPVPAAGWREWAGEGPALAVLTDELRQLGIPPHFLEQALQSPDWLPLAALDATHRLLRNLVAAKALQKGPALNALFQKLWEDASQSAPTSESVVPPSFWYVLPTDPDEEGEPQLLLTGAVIIAVAGKNKEAPSFDRLPPELQAALQAPPTQPGRVLLSLLLGDITESFERPSSKSPQFAAVALVAGLSLLSSLSALLEAVLLRGLVEMGPLLPTLSQRGWAIGGLSLFLLLQLGLDATGQIGSLWLGRRLEARARMAFMERIPRLGDRYFHSRLITDLAERSHSLYILRQLPALARNALSALMHLMVACLGLLILDIRLLPILLLVLTLSFTIPLLFQPALSERDLRLRSHISGLSKFYLDALRGAIPIRAHGAEQNIRHAHEGQLSHWARAAFGQQGMAVAADMLSHSAVMLGVIAILGFYLSQHGPQGTALLAFWWALQLPAASAQLVEQFRQYPSIKNIVLRLLEPLESPTEAPVQTTAAPMTTAPVAIQMQDVHVIAGGRPLLEEINLEIPAGSHIAIVGRSGAGKSTLLGLLLGWHTPAAGRLDIDGESLQGDALYRLRRRTAWVDPSIELWNRSLLSNLRYGNETLDPSAVLHQADLRHVLARLPEGLSTPLGESGSRLSGGEGQRVRLGRAMLRDQSGLVLLDEPFRGLDRPSRQTLLRQARLLWAESTLLCISHDVRETLTFPRVLVVENGRIIEDGAPEDLMQQPSRYAELLQAEETLHRDLWGPQSWTRLRLEAGQLQGPKADP